MSQIIIHVNRQHIAMNSKDGGERPVYIVRQGRHTSYGQSVRITGVVDLVDPRSHPPLPCGARAWIEVISGEVEIAEACSFQEARAIGKKETEPI